MRGLFFLAGLWLYAQHRCGTMERLSYLMQQDPTIVERLHRVEEETRAYIEQIERQPSLRTQNVIVIPVVVHVVYRTAAENISDAQILSQIEVLNEDFRRQNADRVNTPSLFANVAADAEIQFCLATRDPQGNPTTGITRTQTNKTAFSIYSDDVKFSNLGGRDAWPTDQYLNIWVCRLSGGILGYAQLPGGGPSETDGVVVDFRYFGRGGSAQAPYNKGRTATHEVGHWLNLRHIWGDAQCGDDYVNDTPPQAEAHYGCPSFPSPSCGNTSDMFMNYMDYTDDACMNLFTHGQRNRMRALFSLTGYRRGLLTSLGCAAPGSCTGSVTLTAFSGALSDGSGDYPNNADCRWLIEPPGAISITLRFRSLDLLVGDSVIVYDGATTSAPRLGAFSGNYIPPPLTSSQGRLLVRLKTNASGRSSGFEATYTTQLPTLCGGTQLLTQPTGNLTDGSGADPYHNNADCKWIIQSRQGAGIRIQFSRFRTEQNYDFLSIYDGAQVNSRYMVRRFSGTSLPPIVTTALPEATIYFTTDESITDDGWALNYEVVDTLYCRGQKVLTSSSGILSDGSAQSDYTNRTNCSWLIAPPGATWVRLTFQSFSTEANYDFVRIYDGSTPNAPLLGSFSGATLPPSLTAQSGKMLIVFTSDSSITRAGWEASYASDGQPAATPYEEPLNGVRFYPIPARERLWIYLPGFEAGVLSVYDVQGRLLLHEEWPPGESAISLEGWPVGLYLARLQRGGSFVSFRFLHE
ncbi:MAG: CUB domain-containing protein [Bacteroidia bacterium]|nr:M43 family zinc metalloprotease [Bacteroidia bacterium]MDW8014385.1 CUB domain-containing protein [Bacteroidia bacterium]